MFCTPRVLSNMWCKNFLTNISYVQFIFDNVNFKSVQSYVVVYTWYNFILYSIFILLYTWYYYIPFSINILVKLTAGWEFFLDQVVHTWPEVLHRAWQAFFTLIWREHKNMLHSFLAQFHHGACSVIVDHPLTNI